MCRNKFSNQQSKTKSIGQAFKGGVEGILNSDTSNSIVNDDILPDKYQITNDFDKYNSTPDGHCLIYSLICCMYHATGKSITVS